MLTQTSSMLIPCRLWLARDKELAQTARSIFIRGNGTCGGKGPSLHPRYLGEIGSRSAQP